MSYAFSRTLDQAEQYTVMDTFTGVPIEHVSWAFIEQGEHEPRHYAGKPRRHWFAFLHRPRHAQPE